jgi:hypothetical protein
VDLAKVEADLVVSWYVSLDSEVAVVAQALVLLSEVVFVVTPAV